ncbi:MAG: hypothetical protein RL726_1461 [Actinomycetota bacterium]
MNRKDTFARRVVPALTLIGASGAILAALDRPSDGLDAAVGPPLSTATNESTVTVIPTIAPSSGAATTQTTVVGDQNSTQATNPPTPTPTVAPVVESTVPPAPAPVACGGMILGPTIDTKFGPVQVQASVDSTGYVCSAQGVVWPTRDRESVDINNQAVPLLDQWAAYQHDASFNSISGATYTSKAYKQSLQAIIDGARA